MTDPTLARMMSPEFITAQAKYENYRIAVDKGYKMAMDLIPYSDYEFAKDDPEHGRLYKVIDKRDNKPEEVVKSARVLIAAIYEDMVKAIDLLEENKKK